MFSLLSFSLSCLNIIEARKAGICLTFPITNVLKKGDVLSPLFFNFTLEYAITRVQVSQDGLKLNGTHQLLVYADDVNPLKTKRRLLYLKTQFVPRSKHFSSRL